MRFFFSFMGKKLCETPSGNLLNGLLSQGMLKLNFKKLNYIYYMVSIFITTKG